MELLLGLMSFAMPAPPSSAQGVREWGMSLTAVDGVQYILVSTLLPPPCISSRSEEEMQLARSLARARWSRFRSYWQLTTLFRDMRRERNRDPLLTELFAFLQFPRTYDWRNPNENERYLMLRWAQGMDDTRPREDIYARSKWLADRAGLCNGES